MADLTELYTRLILDLDRDDMDAGGGMEQAKIDAVAGAIEKNADELFWFNRFAGTVTTVANTATVALPAGMRVARTLSYLSAPLVKVDLDAIEASYNAASPLTGLPTRWAEDGGSIHFWPTPNAAYSLSIYGIADLGVPAPTNAWSTEAYDLTLADAKIILCRGALRDADGLALAKDAREEALAALRRATRRRGAVAATTDLPRRGGFNINAG